MIKVVFVCLGNICRSPMAEALFKDLVKKRGLTGRFEIASKATSSWETGNPVHSGTKAKLQEHNISVVGMYSSQITKADFDYYDYIIAMDHSNIMDLKKMSPPNLFKKIHLLLDVNHHTKNRSVPDPWYTNDFEETYQLINEALESWLRTMSES